MKIFSTLLLLSIPLFSERLASKAQGQTGNPDTGNVESGTYLFHACQASIRVMDSPTASEEDIRDGAFCAGYFHAFGDYNDMNSGSSICLSNARVGTSIRVYSAYMEKNPKGLDAPMIVGVIQALKDAYPCQSPKGQP